MRILLFGGGLGNQIFQYAFYCYLRRRFPKEKVFGVYNKFWLREHNGLEINKRFNVALPPRSFLIDLLSGLLYFLKIVHPKTKLLDLSTRIFQNENALFLNAYKLNHSFIPEVSDWISFKKFSLSGQNLHVYRKIKSTQSIFIHVRRGDYLSEKYKHRFENTCTVEYYRKALSVIYEKVEDPVFFCFSDDIEWMKLNLALDNATFIDWNTGADSYIDMYLMSQCYGGIIANSTFSYWGARLGLAKNLILYPQRWINSDLGQPDIFPEGWIEI